ncbi:glycosyltransferase family 4 protein [Thermoactinomyces sp. DSM 45892]|uniref:glycosyltransferase family 4 protein n=1 Tax=Thermoactinomyces sp. DSM 45892 TaxID=1882753 RepID=UPI00089A1A1A|nr:glycosyltransferase family 4 protein [Thermoactinomyces sp. DSM 45892]SDZ04716.1 Glycosyl transferases group 1 [Thermoactinomyces sp. DSM 45892]
MKKILFFSHICQEKAMSGAEKTMLQLIQKMSEKHNCLCVLPQSGELSRQITKLHIPTIFCKYSAVWSVKDVQGDFQMELDHICSQGEDEAIRQVMKQVRPDYVVVNTSVNLLPAIIAKEENIPIIWFLQEHVPTYKEQWFSLVQRMNPVIIGISESVLEPFRLRGYPDHKVHCLYPYWNESDHHALRSEKMNRQLRRRYQIPHSSIVVGTIAIKVNVQKGIWHVVQAMTPLMKQDHSIHLLLRATRPINHKNAHFRQIHEHIAKVRLQNRVHWIPFVKDIARVYSALDLVVVPSVLPEGFGLTALEGMGHGKPVIAYPSGGLQEIFYSTLNESYLAKRINPNALRKVICPLLQSDELRKQVGERNRIQAIHQFGPDMYDKRYQMLEEKLEWY